MLDPGRVPAALLTRATDVFGTREKALEWLNSPIPALGDQIPAVLITSDAGLEQVLATLGRIEYGVFS